MRYVINFCLFFASACALSLNACDCEDLVAEAPGQIVTGTVTVATDNQSNPVEIAYKTQGKNDGRPVIVFADGYLGINSWEFQQKAFGIKYHTISYDPIGYGLSSHTDPADLDGVNGHTGYSFRQQATFLHKLLEELDPQGPITFVAVDTQGQVGVWYATDYKNDPHAITKLVLESATLDEVVSDDPCSLAFLNVEQAQQLVGLYHVDPAMTLNLLFGGSFATQSCPEVEQTIMNLATDYALTATPAIFERVFLGTLTESVAHLMADIEIPVLTLYGTSGDVHPISRRAVGASFFGVSTGHDNPAIPGECTDCTSPSTEPFTDSRFITYTGHGTVVHLTSCRRFNRDLKDFVTGDDAACSICLPSGI